ncbi:putative reverse transcriptase domain-containing protein [Tanacetum coccineum]|uniref:Reverse transcriptase domain-containing protein n=1 Tax=Tanacetum coccineum TaxID=301880 RepID=A0ABQ5FW25_9ASTR
MTREEDERHPTPADSTAVSFTSCRSRAQYVKQTEARVLEHGRIIAFDARELPRTSSLYSTPPSSHSIPRIGQSLLPPDTFPTTTPDISTYQYHHQNPTCVISNPATVSPTVVPLRLIRAAYDLGYESPEALDRPERQNPDRSPYISKRIGIALRRALIGLLATMEWRSGVILERDVGMDRHAHARSARLMETEARMSRAGIWDDPMECESADRRRQAMITEMLVADHRRQEQLAKALKLVKRLQTQMAELQRQQGPANGPAQPELPEEAGSSS